MSYVNPSFFGQAPSSGGGFGAQRPSTSFQPQGQLIDPSYIRGINAAYGHNAPQQQHATVYGQPQPLHQQQQQQQQQQHLGAWHGDQSTANTSWASQNKHDRSTTRSTTSTASTHRSGDIMVNAATHKELKELMTKVAMLTTQLDAKQTSLLQLQGEVRKERTMREDGAKREKNALKEVTEMRLLMRTLGDSVTALNAKNDALSKEATQARDGIDGYKLQIASTTEKNTFVTRRNEILLAKCEKMHKELEASSGVSKADVAFVEMRLKSLQRDLQTARDDGLKGERTRTELEGRLSTADARWQKSLVRVAELERRVEEEARRERPPTTAPTPPTMLSSEQVLAAFVASNAANSNATDGEKRLRTDFASLKAESEIVFNFYRAKLERTTRHVEELTKGRTPLSTVSSSTSKLPKRRRKSDSPEIVAEKRAPQRINGVESTKQTFEQMLAGFSVERIVPPSASILQRIVHPIGDAIVQQPLGGRGEGLLARNAEEEGRLARNAEEERMRQEIKSNDEKLRILQQLAQMATRFS